MKIKEKELEKILDELKTIATMIGASVRFERGDFKGGYCVVKESKQIVINKLTPVQRKVTVLAAALNEIGLEDVYLSPKLRQVIEEMDSTL